MGLYADSVSYMKKRASEPASVKDIRTKLVKLLKSDGKDSVFYMSDENMPAKHVIPYATSQC